MPKPAEERPAGEFWANVLGVCFVIAIIVSFIEQHWVYFAVPAAIAAVAVGVFLYFNSNSYKLKVAWREAKEEYDTLRAQYRQLTLCPPEKVAAVVRRLIAEDGVDPSAPTGKWFVETVTTVYRRDYRGRPLPVLPAPEELRDIWQLPEILKEAREVLAYAEHEVARVDLTLDLVKRVAGGVWEFVNTCPLSGPLAVQIYEAVPDIRDMVTSMSAYFFLGKYSDLGVGEWLRDKFLENRYKAALQSKTEAEIERTGTVSPDNFDGTAEEVVDAYLGGTPFLELFTQAVPLPLPHRLRAEHMVIVAGTGAGKSQLLESMILADLDEADPPGLVVIDSKAGHDDLLQRVARLDVFHPKHGRLRDRLLIIDPRDEPALNMFDVGADRIRGRLNDVLASVRYFIGSLLGNELSNQMNVLFLPLLHIVLRIPGATLHTFAEIVEDPMKHRDIIEQLPDGPKNFLLKHYDNTTYRVTKSSIITRLYEIMNEVDLDHMFSAPRNAIDLAAALNDGKIILVSTERSYLQHLSPIFGRYIISRVISAALERASIPKEARRPAYLYVDECAPYVDEKIDELLTTMRSYGLGGVLAFQDVRQMGAYTHAIQGNTAIKVMGEVSDGDARAFAADMRTSPEFIKSQRRQSGDNPEYGSFACYTRDLAHAVGVQLRFGALNDRLMDDDAYATVRARNRERVCRPRREAPPPGRGPVIDGTTTELRGDHAMASAVAPPEQHGKPDDPTGASPEW